MATRDIRISEFDQGEPLVGKPLELLCEDQSGTYSLPYACQWQDGQWRNAALATVITTKILGWRVPRYRFRK